MVTNPNPLVKYKKYQISYFVTTMFKKRNLSTVTGVIFLCLFAMLFLTILSNCLILIFFSPRV